MPHQSGSTGGALGLRWAALLSFAASVCDVAAIEGQDARFLIVSAPVDGNIYYKILPGFETKRLPWKEQNNSAEMLTLIDGSQACSGSGCSEDDNKGLKSPQGIALFEGGNPYGKTLYVSDCEELTIFKYQLNSTSHAAEQGASLIAGPQQAVLRNVQGGARWLAVDGLGNLFFTVEEKNEIQMITYAELLKKPGEAVAKVIYAAPGQSSVSNPGGIAADNFFLYWTNKANGQVAGSVVQGYEQPKPSTLEEGTYPKSVAQNLDVTFGVCLVKDIIYFTNAENTLFAVKKTGGAISEITNLFQQPRGCAWDGDGTLYVADKKANAIYSLPSNRPALRAAKHILKVATVSTPCQVAVAVHAGARALAAAPAFVAALFSSWLFAL